MENERFSQEEYSFIPEYTVPPEYTPEYPDVSFFQESSVTCREENVFRGEVPPGEEDPNLLREEKRKKQSRYAWLRNLLGSAIRGGAILVALGALLAAALPSMNAEEGSRVDNAKKLLVKFEEPPFHQPEDYTARQLGALWRGEPNAPHKYDFEHAHVRREASCREDGIIEYTCTECGLTIRENVKGGHIPAEAVMENEKGALCTEGGSYDSVVYCAVCGEEISRREVKSSATGHIPAEAVTENETIASCTEDGTADEVIYCSVCHTELSREHVKIPAPGHTPAEAVVENEVDALCTEGGSYDSVVYCSVCHEELSRETIVQESPGHVEAEAVVENETAATCQEEGSYESVVYCKVCGEELSREVITLPLAEHTPAEETEENRIEATCTKDGSYDLVTYCEVCGEELSRESVLLQAEGHQPGSAKEENRVAATCTAEGGYDTVVYCSVCGEELSREHTVLAKTAHSAAAAVRENEKGASCTAPGSYDEVVYCSVCHTELSRSNKTVAALGHNWGTPAYTWSADNSSVTATCICTRDSSHTQSETVRSSSATALAATCTTTGNTRYTATFTKTPFTQQTKTVTGNIPVTAHTPGTAVSENVTEATCTAAGGYDSVVYCSVCNTKLSSSHVTEGSPLGHSFTLGVWDEENPLVCSRCQTAAMSFSFNANSLEFTYTLNDDFVTALRDGGYSGELYVQDGGGNWLTEASAWNNGSSGSIPCHAEATTVNCHLTFMYYDDSNEYCAVTADKSIAIP